MMSIHSMGKTHKQREPVAPPRADSSLSQELKKATWMGRYQGGRQAALKKQGGQSHGLISIALLSLRGEMGPSDPFASSAQRIDQGPRGRNRPINPRPWMDSLSCELRQTGGHGWMGRLSGPFRRLALARIARLSNDNGAVCLGIRQIRWPPSPHTPPGIPYEVQGTPSLAGLDRIASPALSVRDVITVWVGSSVPGPTGRGWQQRGWPFTLCPLPHLTPSTDPHD